MNTGRSPMGMVIAGPFAYRAEIAPSLERDPVLEQPMIVEDDEPLDPVRGYGVTQSEQKDTVTVVQNRWGGFAEWWTDYNKSGCLMDDGIAAQTARDAFEAGRAWKS